jgi:hypothetical protein
MRFVSDQRAGSGDGGDANEAEGVRDGAVVSSMFAMVPEWESSRKLEDGAWAT